MFGIIYRKKIAESKIGSAEEYALKIRTDAERLMNASKKEAESIKKELLLEAKEEIHNLRLETEHELKERRIEVQKLENRVQQKEEAFDKKTEMLENQEKLLLDKQTKLDQLIVECHEIKEKELEELVKISGLNKEEAKNILMGQIVDEAKKEAIKEIKEIENETKETSAAKAREIIAYAIQRSASVQVGEASVSVVPLPNNDMKGRIIGREGRNIRTLESLTGIDFIIDDTPEAVVLSGFDPIRREVARLTLEKLIVDGRIHPARIEETFEQCKREVDTIIKEEGQNAAIAAGVNGLHPELIKILGRLRYRTSYGQNVLAHSIEVSNLASIMAGELGVKGTVAKRAGLLHDIGKSAAVDTEGTHVTIGMNIAKKYGESPQVIQAIAAHHGDVEVKSIDDVLVQAADAISAARPGARRENIEIYLKRLQKLEEIANSFKGVEKAFAMQAGREIRIIVNPTDVTDEEISIMAHDIVKRIQSEIEYPGQIKVNVIRELRATEFAK